MECFTRADLHLSIVLFWDTEAESPEVMESSYGKFSAALQHAKSRDLLVDVRRNKVGVNLIGYK